MKLIAIDPSSTRTGYAVGTGPLELIEAGLLLPRKGDAGALDRIRSMKTDLLATLREHQPDALVMEVPNGKVHRGRGGAGAGLSVYGLAVGVLVDVCWEYQRWQAGKGRTVTMATPDQNEWTQSTKKGHRQRCVMADFPGRYDPKRDPGMDVADAIGLMQWWFRRQERRGAA